MDDTTIRTGGRAGKFETLADYRAAQREAYLRRNAAAIRREFWERKRRDCRP